MYMCVCMSVTICNAISSLRCYYYCYFGGAVCWRCRWRNLADHLSLSKGQFQYYDADDMLIANHLTAYCSLFFAIYELAQLSQVLLTWKKDWKLVINMVICNSITLWLHYSCILCVIEMVYDYQDCGNCKCELFVLNT